jgi:hypothetical protein
VPVPTGIGHQQDDLVHSAVPLLPVQSPFQGLEVVENGLGLDGNPPAAALDQQVPRSEVAPDRQRNLGPALETCMQVRDQAIHESLLARVTDGIAGWIGAEDEIKPDRSTPGANVLERHVVDGASLEPQQLLMGRAGCFGHGSQAESGADPRRTDLAPDDAEGRVSAASAAVRGPLPGTHRTIMPFADYLPIT